MKIKMPCKLCEMTVDHQKLGVPNCTHNPFALPQFPPMVPFNIDLGLQSTHCIPQLRDVMLAYLFRGYYQPAGPLISVAHAHAQQPLGKTGPLSETSPSVSPPPSSHQPPAPSSAGDSSDNDVIITSVTTAKEASPPQQQQHQHQQQTSQTYRLSQYPPTHATGYPYAYPAHYYPVPPVPPPPPAPAYAHHDLCYSPNPYLHHKYSTPTTYRRYLGPPPGAQYFQTQPPDLYGPQPPPPTAAAASQQNQQVVTATTAAAASGSSYQPSPSGPQPQPTLLDSYQPPPPTLVETYHPPPHYYSGYGPAPPACYTHSPQPRGYINAPYPCPCPMQSCPKNVHTGPLIGDIKRSSISSITKDSAVYLPPVALALPMEPASATGPPSPARGSAGMPPPPSPAGATYQAPPTPKRETPEPLDLKSTDKRRKARVGKSFVRNNLHQNNMLLMCKEPVHNTYLDTVKREVESPKDEQRKEPARIEDDSKIQTTNIVEVETATMKQKIEEDKAPPIEQLPCLKTEENDAEKERTDDTEKPAEGCVKTVAENVKVKNMKRKSSTAKIEDTPAVKKEKLEKLANGSYKDLIKKSFTSVHINNGKRKLLSNRTLVHRLPKIRLKKPTSKQKISAAKEELHRKLKTSKPLTASNLHNSKQNLKENKDQCFVDLNLIENKELQRKFAKKPQFKCVVNGKKFAPAILDSLILKNSVDVTIESVVSENKPRTVKNVNALRTNVDKCPKAAPKPEIKKDPMVSKKSTNIKCVSTKSKVGECRQKGAGKRKTKCKSVEVVPLVVSKVPRRSLPLPRWSNGWTWKGDPFEGKVFLNSDEATMLRKCYPAMRHQEGDAIEPGDCVLLKAGARKNDLPFVAKIASLWENPDDGEMMMSLLWYYRPEHTEQGRLPSDQPDEVFASRHKDSNSVACVEDKCFVLTFNEYCRYRKNLRRLDEGLEDTGPCIPATEPYPRTNRQPPMSVTTSPEMVFFCRRVYDFRQKRIVKNPS